MNNRIIFLVLVGYASSFGFLYGSKQTEKLDCNIFISNTACKDSTQASKSAENFQHPIDSNELLNFLSSENPESVQPSILDTNNLLELLDPTPKEVWEFMVENRPFCIKYVDAITSYVNKKFNYPS